MSKYRIEFIFNVEVQAEDEDEAVEKAEQELNYPDYDECRVEELLF